MPMDRLQECIRKKKTPICLGLDPRLEYIPDGLVQKGFEEYGQTLKGAAEIYYEFCCGLVDSMADIVPVVKLQSACFEALGYQGVEVFGRLVRYCKDRELYVIADCKRGDIDVSAESYSAAYIGTVKIGEMEYEPFGCDSVTVNGYLGSDGIKPFFNTCLKHDKTAFVLVKTSNRSALEFQDLIAGDRYAYNVMGDLTEYISKKSKGKYGFNALGAVVGATQPDAVKELRKRLENTFFLVPGFGAQGATAFDAAHAFNKFGHGAVVSASRQLMCAWKRGLYEGDYMDTARSAALDMKADLKCIVQVL